MAGNNPLLKYKKATVNPLMKSVPKKNVLNTGFSILDNTVNSIASQPAVQEGFEKLQQTPIYRGFESVLQRGMKPIADVYGKTVETIGKSGMTLKDFIDTQTNRLSESQWYTTLPQSQSKGLSYSDWKKKQPQLTMPIPSYTQKEMMGRESFDKIYGEQGQAYSSNVIHQIIDPLLAPLTPTQLAPDPIHEPEEYKEYIRKTESGEINKMENEPVVTTVDAAKQALFLGLLPASWTSKVPLIGQLGNAGLRNTTIGMTMAGNIPGTREALQAATSVVEGVRDFLVPEIKVNEDDPDVVKGLKKVAQTPLDLLGYYVLFKSAGKAYEKLTTRPITPNEVVELLKAVQNPEAVTSPTMRIAAGEVWNQFIKTFDNLRNGMVPEDAMVAFREGMSKIRLPNNKALSDAIVTMGKSFHNFLQDPLRNVFQGFSIKDISEVGTLLRPRYRMPSVTELGVTIPESLPGQMSIGMPLLADNFIAPDVFKGSPISENVVTTETAKMNPGVEIPVGDAGDVYKKWEQLFNISSQEQRMWYDDMYKFIGERTRSPEDADIFFRLIAITSPNTAIKQNLKFALRLYSDYEYQKYALGKKLEEMELSFPFQQMQIDKMKRGEAMDTNKTERYYQVHTLQPTDTHTQDIWMQRSMPSYGDPLIKRNEKMVGIIAKENNVSIKKTKELLQEYRGMMMKDMAADHRVQPSKYTSLLSEGFGLSEGKVSAILEKWQRHIDVPSVADMKATAEAITALERKYTKDKRKIQAGIWAVVKGETYGYFDALQELRAELEVRDLFGQTVSKGMKSSITPITGIFKTGLMSRPNEVPSNKFVYKTGGFLHDVFHSGGMYRVKSKPYRAKGMKLKSKYPAGTIPFIHFGKVAGLRRLEVKYSGTGMAGEEKWVKAQYPEYQNRLYAYVANSKFQKEFGLPDHVYYGALPESRVLNYGSKEHREIIEQVKKKLGAEAGDQRLVNELAIKEMKKRGYDALNVTPSGRNGLIIFNDVNVKQVSTGTRTVSAGGYTSGHVTRLAWKTGGLGKQTPGDISAQAEMRAATKARSDQEFGTMDNFKEIIKGREYVILTAANPHNVQLTLEENNQRNVELEKMLNEKGILYKKQKGVYDGKSEESYFILDQGDAFAMEMIELLEQESVITKRGMVYADGSYNPIKKDVSYGNKFKDNYSEIELQDGNVQYKLDFEWGSKKVLPTVIDQYFAKPKNRAETRTIKYVKDNIEKAEADYMKQIQKDYNGATNVISADSAKYIIPGYSGELAADYHEAASGLAKYLYDKWLKEKRGEKNNTVLFTAGGTGVGKTTAVRNTIELDQYPIVYDTNFTGVQSPKGKIQKTLDAGFNVDVVLVHRDPIDAFENGVIPRVKKHNRVVPISEHIHRHTDVIKYIKHLMDLFKDKVKFYFIDNSRGRGKQQLTTIDKLPLFGYTRDALNNKLYEVLTRAEINGLVTREQAERIGDTENVGRATPRGTPKGYNRGLRTVTAKIRDLTGQTKQASFVEDENGDLVEFDVRDLNKYYESIEREQKEAEYLKEMEKAEKEIYNTRKFKQSGEYKEFAEYAEEVLSERDIYPALFGRHISMTAERAMEYLEQGIGGYGYQTMIKPVYDSAVKMKIEMNQISEDIKKYGIVDGSISSRRASLWAQRKPGSRANKNETLLADYARKKYDEWLDRANAEREIVGLDPIKKRPDYVTHMNELSILSEFFGGMDRVSIRARIAELKKQLLEEHPDWSEARAFEAAKREIEGTTGIGQYIDAKQPYFRWMKERLSEYEKNPNLIASLEAYIEPVMRSIYQTVNIAKNKAYKDLLPPNAKEFFRVWNSELVGGRSPSSIHRSIREPINALRNTIGSNTILGNLATQIMQLTSFPQVVALAGIRNTLIGIGRRMWSYLRPSSGAYSGSRTAIMRSLETDIGLGNTLVEMMLKKIGEYQAANTATVKARVAIEYGRSLLRAMMEQFDQFTVGSTYEAFYNKALTEGLPVKTAREYADIMTGKTQANYFKEGLSPFLNSQTGKLIGQFGTYGMNQWEMFKKDFGKDYDIGGKSSGNLKLLFKQFIKYLTVAYIIDQLGESIFGRQPFSVKGFVDNTLNMLLGKGDPMKLLDSVKDAVGNVIPFTSSIKYNSMPPVFQFGSDMFELIFGSYNQRKEAVKSMSDKWAFNILLPYGGNQLRKTLEGIEATTGYDMPFVSNKTVTDSGNVRYEIDELVEQIKAVLFGPSATEPAMEYYEELDSPSEKEQFMPTYNRLLDVYKNNPSQYESEYAKLTEEEKDLFQRIKRDRKAEATKKWHDEVKELRKKADALYKSGDKAGAKAIESSLTGDKLKYFRSIK
jgi:hypothetical protein